MNFIKLTISIIFDVLDFFVRVPGFGTIWDIGGGVLSILLWGAPGAAQLLEVLDITDQIDSFIPTVTLAGLYNIFFMNK
jgi:hypothetical protein